MKGYIKYLVLFIVLIGIGMLGINLYSKETLKETKKNNTLAQNTEEKQQETIEAETKQKEQENEVEVDITNNNQTTTNTTEKETSKGYIKENTDNNNNQTTDNTTTNHTDSTVNSSSSNIETKKEETSPTNNSTTNSNTNKTTSSVATISEETTDSYHVIEIDPKIYSSTSNTTTNSNNNSTSNNNNIETKTENIITITPEEQSTTSTNSSNTQNSTNTSTQNSSPSSSNTTNSKTATQNNNTQSTTTTKSTTNNLSNLETATSYTKVKVLKTLTSADLTKKVSVVGNNGSGIAQSFCVAENNYITAQINSTNTRTLIQVYDKTTGKKKNTIVSNFYHANGMTYNKNTGNIYLVHNNNNKYSIFSNNGIETTTKLNPTTNNLSKSVSGIAYDDATNQYYAAKGNYVYVYDNNFKLIRTIKKLRAGTPQDIGAYKGIILIIVYQPNNSAANNAIDLYRASDGAYLGTYNLKFSNMELESIDYYGTGNTFSLYFNRLGKSTDYIYTTNKIDLK